MNTVRITGRRMVFWGAVMLLAWAVYELAIRFEEMVTWLSPVYSLVQQGKITFMDYLRELNWLRLQTHLFLLLCACFAIFALLARKGLITGILSIPIAVLLIIFSLGSTPLMSANLWQKLKLIPLALIGAGSLLKVIGGLSKDKTRPVGPVQTHQPQPYDPFRMNRGQ